MTCEICDDFGIVYADVQYGHPAFGKSFPCPASDCVQGKQRRLLRARQIFQDSKLPKRYQDLTLESFENLPTKFQEGKLLGYAASRLFCEGQRFSLADAYQAIGVKTDLSNRAYHSQHNWVVLSGANGVGKTGLAAGVTHYLANRGTPVLFLRVQDFLQSIIRTYDERTEIDTFTVIKTAQEIDFLVLDEFNLPKVTDHSRDKMEQLIRYRYNHEKPVFITTNLSVEQFRREWGSQIGSVASESHWIQMGGLILRDEALKAVVSL